MNYLYDGPNLLEEVDSSGNVLGRYTQGVGTDEPLAELRAGTTSYYEQDGPGSISSLSNGAGVLANTYTYDSYGKVTASTGTVVNSFQYAGRESDQETGIYYYRARYYDPSTGRFLSEDPIAFNGGVDFYSYVSNNPVNFIDPKGLQQQSAPATPKYNCLAWGLGLDWVWVQPSDGKSPNTVFPAFGCTKVPCGKDLDCSKRWKVKVFEDSANSTNWHVERQTCSKGWTSKNGAAPQYDNIKDPDQYYQDIYHPSGNVTKTCWSCPAGPPMTLPDDPKIRYIH